MAMTDSQKAIMKCKSTGVIQTILGWVFVVFWGFCAIAVGTQITESIDVVTLLILLAFTAGGVWLIRKGKIKMKFSRMFQEYNTRLDTDPTKSIDLLASSVGKSVDTVKKDITKMINMGLFQNAYINQELNCIVFPQMGFASTHPANSVHQQVNTPGVEFVTVKCSGCGAINKIAKSTVSECEYCGAQIADK
jgi:ribosomal protein S27E